MCFSVQTILFKPPPYLFNSLCSATFYISALTFSLLQTQHLSYWLYNPDTIFPTCFDPGLAVGDCNNCFYFSGDYFQVHDYQLLLFIYVIKIQFQVIANNFILILYHSKKYFSYVIVLFQFSEIFLQVRNIQNIQRMRNPNFALNIQGVQ